MNSSLNSTFIALIIKINNLTLVSEFRFISLCNILYKLVLKVITNRFKHVISFIISKNQSAFILWRLITNNIFVAHELLHSMKRKEHKGTRRVALKLDMSKVYDGVKLGYIQAIMSRLGFSTILDKPSHVLCNLCTLLGVG